MDPRDTAPDGTAPPAPAQPSLLNGTTQPAARSSATPAARGMQDAGEAKYDAFIAALQADKNANYVETLTSVLRDPHADFSPHGLAGQVLSHMLGADQGLPSEARAETPDEPTTIPGNRLRIPPGATDIPHENWETDIPHNPGDTRNAGSLDWLQRTIQQLVGKQGGGRT